MTTTSRLIRVVMVIQEYHPIVGGAQKQLASQVNLLKNMGVDIHIITRRWPGLSPFETVRGIPVYRMLSRGPRPIAAITFIFSAVLKLFWLKPDIIHAFELLSPSTVSVLAKWILRRPLVVKVLRGGVLGDLKKIGSGLLGRWRVPFVVNAADVFVVISREIDSELAALGVLPGRRAFIPNGVDVDRFIPASLVEKEVLRAQLGLPKGLLAVFTGRLESEKRLDQLVALWPSVQVRYPDAHLLLVGTGAQEQSLRHNAGEGVCFTGSVDDVAPYLRAADIFVLPSVAEGLSNALLEGLSCGLAVVATSVGGATDVVKNNNNGLLIPPDAPEELLTAILHLFDNAKLRQRLGVAGRQLIVNNYSMAKVVCSVQQLYRSLLIE